MSRRHHILLIGLLWAQIDAGPVMAGTLFVDDSAPPGGDGLTWNAAINDLQAALALANVPGNAIDEVRLGQGTYKPSWRSDPGDPRSATFVMRSGLRIAGGYAGFGASNPDLRDVDQFRSTLSGDLAGNDGPPGSFLNYGENAYHVLVAVAIDDSAQLDGVTVAAGSSCCGFEQFDPRSWGAGVHSIDAGLTFTNCTFQYNDGGRGGGGYFEGGAPTFTDCLFFANRAGTTNQRGGAIYAEGANLELHNCAFLQNLAARGGAIHHREGGLSLSECSFAENQCSGGHGGAIYAQASTLLMQASTFTSNSTSSAGGAVSSFLNVLAVVDRCTFSFNSALDASGGAIYVEGGTFTLLHSEFLGNSAVGDGGAVKSSATARVQRCSFVDNSSNGHGGGFHALNGSMTECLFDSNSSTFGGGALGVVADSRVGRCVFQNNSSGNEGGACETSGAPLIENCLFQNNSSWLSGAAIHHWNSPGTSHLVVSNCQFVQNEAGTAGGSAIQNNGVATINNCVLWSNAPAQVKGLATTVHYSDVQGGWSGAGTNNIDADPLFTNAPAGDFSLRADSPCIDAADTLVLDRASATDLAGHPRFRDDPDTPDTGNGPPPVVDMGCYEFQPRAPLCAADCAQPPDGIVNIDDLLALILDWGGGGGLPTDINGDGQVNIDDLLEVIHNWGPCP